MSLFQLSDKQKILCLSYNWKRDMERKCSRIGHFYLDSFSFHDFL